MDNNNFIHLPPLIQEQKADLLWVVYCDDVKFLAKKTPRNIKIEDLPQVMANISYVMNHTTNPQIKQQMKQIYTNITMQIKKSRLK
jgi:hypothetical protein